MFPIMSRHQHEELLVRPKTRSDRPGDVGESSHHHQPSSAPYSYSSSLVPSHHHYHHQAPASSSPCCGEKNAAGSSSGLVHHLHHQHHQQRQNPSPKPLGSDIQVVAHVQVGSDPALLQDQDSVLECLGPLLVGGFGGFVSTTGAAAENHHNNNNENNKKRPAIALASEKQDIGFLQTAACGVPRTPPSPKKQQQQQRRRISTSTTSSSNTAGNGAVLLQVEEQRGGELAKNCDNTTITSNEVGLTDHQAALWDMRFKELVDFRARFGHCLVPHKWWENLALATWVKRQRYQWKLREQGKRSTLTQERGEALSELGFVWDSHNATWEERFNELVEYKRLQGHTSVPSTDRNHPLSVWVQCQRRQWKLMKDEDVDTPGYQIKQSRVERLEALGFIFEPRKRHRGHHVHPAHEPSTEDDS